ncbi:MAG: phosphohydrolase [Chloroflexi bacterium SZAS-1]|nr:phosphohydrolase [Chloroflexi bacterium SZAS-1]
MNTTPDFEQARHYALYRLSCELSPALVYHSLAHTCNEVVPAAERFGALTHLSTEELCLLRTAAYYHDIGFVACYAGHEEASVGIARAILPTFGYAPTQINSIAQLIMATKLPQAPSCPLAQLLADADLDVLGRDDFLERNQALRAELASYGGVMTDEGWYANQLKFVRNHRYWTPVAARLRNAGKRRNLIRLQEQLALVVEQPNR